jgi:hypothetical protein
MKKMLNEGNQIHNLYLVPVLDVINYDSGSDFLTSTVLVPLVKKLRFLRFRFHNTGTLVIQQTRLRTTLGSESDQNICGNRYDKRTLNNR